MEKLNPEKLHVEFRQGVTAEEPIVNRRYTLTHSDITAELFLIIGLEYAYDKINMIMRDEVLGEWRDDNGNIYLYIYVYVNGQYGPVVAEIRNVIFRRELPLALEAIRYGDREFFEAHPELDDAGIWVHFDSTSPEYDKFEYWGTPKDYK